MVTLETGLSRRSANKDRKSTRLNSSHGYISYAVFCLKKTANDLGIQRPTNNVTTSIYKFVLASSAFEIGPTPPAAQSQTQNHSNSLDTVSWVQGAHVF